MRLHYRKSEKPLEVINPLSVSINYSVKKRLILDLRFVNTHICLDEINFEDWKYFEHYHCVKSAQIRTRKNSVFGHFSLSVFRR